MRFNGGQSAVGFILGTHDLDVQYAMSRLIQPGMTVYDIGANVGFTAILAARQVTASGRVICFEPLAVNATAIRHNAQLNGFAHVEIVQTALGIADGEAEFFVSASPTWGRLAQAGEAPMQTGVVRVPVHALDSLSAQWPMPQFIKMDVEGVEADVIRGGVETLRRARPIMVIELHHTYHAVMDALKGLDYAVQPLTEAGNVPSLDGELQIIAYPPDAPRGRICLRRFVAGKDGLSVKRRLLSIAHSYVVGMNRRLAHELARVGADEWDVTAVAPTYFHGVNDLRPVHFTPSDQEPCRVVAVNAYLTGRVHVFVYGWKLRSILAESWDLVHCWEEPYILVGGQIAWWLSTRTPLVYRSAQSLNKNYPIPFNWIEKYAIGCAAGWICSGGLVAQNLTSRAGYGTLPSCANSAWRRYQ